MPENAHPDSTFSSHVHNDWTYLQLNKEPNHPEYPTPLQRGPIPENAHPVSTKSTGVIYEDDTHVQLDAQDYPAQDQRPISMLQAYNGIDSDKRMFDFEDSGDYVQLKSSEYPGGSAQKNAV
jgi:hypothetical protein